MVNGDLARRAATLICGQIAPSAFATFASAGAPCSDTRAPWRLLYEAEIGCECFDLVVR